MSSAIFHPPKNSETTARAASFLALLTEVVDGVARLVERARVELEADDGEDEDGEHDEQADLHERRQGLQDGLQNDLQTCEV